MNALAAAAACLCLGIKPTAVKYGLSGFSGAGRRFEFKGKFNGADVYDDYAHHPGELKALLDAVENLGYKRTVVVFQPHTYSRTKALFDDFVRQLRRPDLVYLAEIFAAREKNVLGISSADLAAKIEGAKFFPTFAEIERDLAENARPGDLVFYPEDEHVGIVCGRDEDGGLLVIHCASSANNVVITGTSGFVSVARPDFYNE